MGTTKIYFDNLDAMRFFACLMVLICHTELDTFVITIFNNEFITRLFRILGSGELGVSFFFVLSGFLITYLILFEEKSYGTFNLKNFYVRRILRIWPLYFLVILFGFFLYPFLKYLLEMDSDIPNKFIYYISFLGNFDHVYNYSILHARSPLMIDSTWSVSIEEQFYLIWPLLFFMLPVKFYKYIFFVLLLSCMIFREQNDSEWYTLYFHTLSVCSDLIIGGFFAYLALYNSQFVRFITKIKKIKIIFVYISGFIFLLYSDFIFPLHFNVVYFKLITGLFFVFIIIEQCYCENSFFKLKKLQRISELGKYTYGMYLIHPIAIQSVVILFKLFNVTYNLNIYLNILYIILSFIFTFILSYISYNYFELYFLRLKQRFTKIKTV